MFAAVWLVEVDGLVGMLATLRWDIKTRAGWVGGRELVCLVGVAGSRVGREGPVIAKDVGLAHGDGNLLVVISCTHREQN
jgi:hypothetical protein